MKQINIVQRQQLANELLSTFDFGAIVRHAGVMRWTDDFSEVVRDVLTHAKDSNADGATTTLRFVVRFKPDNTVAGAFAIRKSGDRQGNPNDSLPKYVQTLSFEDWVARVESEVGAEVEPEGYRRYYDAGLSPADAVLQDRVDNEVLENLAAGGNQTPPAMPEPVRIALEHVASIFPDVTHVFYNRDLRWYYCDDNFDGPDFKDKDIDIGLLEDAVDCLTVLPAAFTLAR